jgi:hypothetical protein
MNSTQGDAMTTMTFQEFLRKKTEELQQDTQRQRKNEWVASVERLMDTIRGWLHEADPEGMLYVNVERLEKGERGLGRYMVPSLRIELGENVVHVLPTARNVIGLVAAPGESEQRAQGRVDITDDAEQFILYRTLQDGQERWYALDEKFNAAPFDRNRLEAILQDLLS